MFSVLKLHEWTKLTIAFPRRHLEWELRIKKLTYNGQKYNTFVSLINQLLVINVILHGEQKRSSSQLSQRKVPNDHEDVPKCSEQGT